MKTIRLFISLIFLFVSVSINAQSIQSVDSTGLAGDNFSLEGALELFRQSKSPEEFEELLNRENSKVNNLDLNNDNETDYIRVVHRTDHKAHVFILQSLVNEKESQDIAVIELEKDSADKATLQIVGDEAIYGKQTVVEPTQKVAVNAGTSTKTLVVNVQPWPVVQYVCRPAYVVYISPWRWRSYPAWYRPWRPVYYHIYYGYHSAYRPYYSYTGRHRMIYAHRVYVPLRTTSAYVHHRYQPVRAAYNKQRHMSNYRTYNRANHHHTANYKSRAYPQHSGRVAYPTQRINKNAGSNNSGRYKTQRPSQPATPHGQNKSMPRTR